MVSLVRFPWGWELLFIEGSCSCKEKESKTVPSIFEDDLYERGGRGMRYPNPSGRMWSGGQGKTRLTTCTVEAVFSVRWGIGGRFIAESEDFGCDMILCRMGRGSAETTCEASRFPDEYEIWGCTIRSEMQTEWMPSTDLPLKNHLITFRGLKQLCPW